MDRFAVKIHWPASHPLLLQNAGSQVLKINRLVTPRLNATKYSLQNFEEIKENGEEAQRNHKGYAACASSKNVKLQRLIEQQW